MMTATHSKADRRLLGTWRSDRRRTLQHYKPGPKSTPRRWWKFRSIFGKLTVRWTARRWYSDFEGSRTSAPYEVVASDETSVVVRGVDSKELVHIHFEGDYYWMAKHGTHCEYFKRVK
jgi:hypothetical protein